jgi:hypothetical protein
MHFPLIDTGLLHTKWQLPSKCTASHWRLFRAAAAAAAVVVVLLTVRINTFDGLIWWWRTNMISPSSGRIRDPPAKRPLILHLRSIGKRLLAFCCFIFPWVAAEVHWDVPLNGRDLWCFFLVEHLWWMGCRDRCGVWNLIRTVAHQP